ncbi:MAG TPA: guanine permease [Porphyromonadaceae bacterium]|nr:guanine permease [Porphyromonadaceae bacterium]
MQTFLENWFQLKKNGTNVKTELIAGLTTFMTMAYILIVNPSMLSECGMDKPSVFTATVVSSIIATLLMALVARLPFALAPGMGLNAFFAYTVVLSMGYSWEMALTAVFIEGIIFMILSLFNVREAIVNAIPMNLKRAVSVGIGLFIAFIGLCNAGIVKQGTGIPVTLGDVTAGSSIVALVGILIMGVLLIKRVKGALLIGILVATIIGIPLGVTHIPESFNLFSLPPSMAPTFGKLSLNFETIFSLDMVLIVFTFMFVDLFDTVGTLVGVASKSGMMDEQGNIPRVKSALMADAVGTTVGAICGTSTVTTYVESASGVAEGGRTGLTALTVAGLFLVALFMAPLFAIIPAAATASALVMVGLFMMSSVVDVDFNDMSESIPAFFTIIMMPMAYSIAEGITFGMLSFVFIKIFTGKAKEVTITMYLIAIFLLVKLALA